MNIPSRSLPDYAELRCISNFTFLRGASHPHELVERAHALGYRALALTDECSLAGAVRAHVAAKAVGLHLLLLGAAGALGLAFGRRRLFAARHGSGVHAAVNGAANGHQRRSADGARDHPHNDFHGLALRC